MDAHAICWCVSLHLEFEHKSLINGKTLEFLVVNRNSTLLTVDTHIEMPFSHICYVFLLTYTLGRFKGRLIPAYVPLPCIFISQAIGRWRISSRCGSVEDG